MTEDYLFKKTFAALRKYAGLMTTANLEVQFFSVLRNGIETHHAVWKHRDGYSYRVAMRGNTILSVVKATNDDTEDLMKSKP